MSKLKFSSNLFLEKIELDRLKKFLDDDGFRQFLLNNSASFGFIRKHNEEFINGLVSEAVSFTVNINEARLINSAGNLIYSPAVEQLAIPDDNAWYWIKIVHAFSSQELGTYSIDTSGNLVCTSGDGELLTILRGQPNYPSRVKFINASNNILEYDVESVVDNNNAILTGTFTAEIDLTLSVIGTFTPGYTPLTDEKNIFQYDSATISLVQSNTTSEPAHTTGLEFFLARVKRNGSSLKIEDKRNDIWTTNTNYYAQHLSLVSNPLIGVEQITFDDQFTPRDKNILEVAWGFRGVTFTVDLKNNKITISAGSGGLFKSSNFSTEFTDGDFDGWRLYTENGKYYKIDTSALNGGNIELNLENIEATSFYSDVDSTSPIVQTLLIVPEAEEIEIICIPDQDVSDPTDVNGIVEVRKVFPINEFYGRLRLTVYDTTAANYTITYRYKHLLHYGPELTIPDDNTGYYNEEQFNVNGYRTGSTRTIYSNGFITLILGPSAFTNVVSGDILGVRNYLLTNSVPVLDLEVGVDKQYQKFTGALVTLSADMFINIKDGIKNGNFFLLQLKQQIDLNGFIFRIVTDYVNPVTFTLLKEFTIKDTSFIFNSEQGLFIRVTFDGTDWFLNSTNEIGTELVSVNSGDEFYYKDGGGYVHLMGTLGAVSGQSTFTLPVGFRPAAAVSIPQIGVDLAAPDVGFMTTIDISTAGVVSCAANLAIGTSRNISLNGISFRATQ